MSEKTIKVYCSNCAGSGEGRSDGSICPACGGDGELDHIQENDGWCYECDNAEPECVCGDLPVLTLSI